MSAVGYRSPSDANLPDVELTGDEFLHMVAMLFALAHGGIEGPHGRGRAFAPGCPACESLMAKNEALVAFAQQAARG